jgi:hypothetical protein
MASSITLKVGALTITKTANATDQQVSDMLLKFYDSIEPNPPPGVTTQDKANAILTWFVRTMLSQSRSQYRLERSAQIESEAGSLYGFE